MKCFVIMPFDSAFDDVYVTIKNTIERAIVGENIECHRLDEKQPAGRITDRLLKALQEATVCVADLTGHKPNVMWETGYAMALGKPLLIVTQDRDGLPFDIRDMMAIQYERTRLSDTLGKTLGQAFKDTIAAYEVPTTALDVVAGEQEWTTIAVTGSMQANHEQCFRRMDIVLRPFLGRHVTWYCGSVGVADLAAVDILSSKKEKVRIVGYHSLDISNEIRNLAKNRGIPFVDARKEALPKGYDDAPSERDVLFLMKSDLVVLFWNGESQGTRRMIDWYAEKGRDHLVAFVSASAERDWLRINRH